MVIFETEVLEIIPRTSNVTSFRFKSADNAEFKAGQFFFLGIKIGEREATKHFSFSNSPTEKGYIEFTKKITDSEFSKALTRLKIGDWAKLKMPYGSFMAGKDDKKIAFLTGGIGVTPVRSICGYITDKNLPLDIIVLYGNRTERDIVFRDDFEEMRKRHTALKIVHILSEAGSQWNGRRGLINSSLIKEEIADYAERKFYICGPPLMVESMKKILLEELGLSDASVVTENFTGY